MNKQEYFSSPIYEEYKPEWVSKLDNASNLGIVDVISETDSITLKTEEIKEEEASDATKQLTKTKIYTSSIRRVHRRGTRTCAS